MSLALALQSGDVTSLPSRRDEAWRYTDLRAALRAIPEVSPKDEAPIAAGPFAGIVEAEALVIVNGFGPDRLTVAPGEHRMVSLRFIASAAARASLPLGGMLAAWSQPAIDIRWPKRCMRR